MDFSLNEEQRLLSDSVERFVRGSYPMETRRRSIHEQGGCNPDIWRQFTELGYPVATAATPVGTTMPGVSFNVSPMKATGTPLKRFTP